MSVPSSGPASQSNPVIGRVRPRGRALTRWWEGFVMAMLVGCAVFSVLITVAIIVVLFGQSVRFFSMEGVSLGGFLLSTEWSPTLSRQHHFGIWPLICGTLSVTAIAMLVALPLGLITAIYLSEFAHARVRATLKPALEVLAGIPTVVYGYFAVTAITPSLKFFYDGFDQFNVTSAGIAVGILCVPTVSSLAEDALRAVPRSLREGAYGLGATKFDVSLRIVVPAALSGIVSAFLLAAARAIGETMIVTLAAGSQAQLTLNPTSQAQTMTGYMAGTALGDTSNFGVEYYSVFAVGATLFLMTLGLTVLGQVVRKRFREAYS